MEKETVESFCEKHGIEPEVLIDMYKDRLKGIRLLMEGDGVLLIAEERKRQFEKEKWSAEHDATHDGGQLATAAACYTLTPRYKREVKEGKETPKNWPWQSKWWKPTPKDRVRELVKAGALIAAEIDRLQSQ